MLLFELCRCRCPSNYFLSTDWQPRVLYCCITVLLYYCITVLLGVIEGRSVNVKYSIHKHTHIHCQVFVLRTRYTYKRPAHLVYIMSLLFT